MRARRLAGTALLALVMAGMAGCQSEDAKTAATPALADPSAATTPTPSPSKTSTPVTPTAAPSAPGRQPSVLGPHDRAALLSAMQAAIATHRSAHMRVSMTGTSSVTATGDVRYAGAGSAMRLTMALPSLGTSNAEVRLVDGIMYVAAPPMTPVGKFVKIDTTDRNSPYAGSFAQLPSQLDPSSSLKVFRAGLRSVRYVGPATVGGERLRHYVFRVDLMKSLAATTSGASTSATAGQHKLVSYQVWLDRDNLERRLRMHTTGTSMAMEMSRWGEPVSVTAPPAADLIIPPGS